MDAESIYLLYEDCESTFKTIYDSHHQKLYNYFLKKTHSAELSEELVQETFIKLWRFRAHLQTDIALDIQIFRIARTTCIDLLRKHARSRVAFVPADDLERVAERRGWVEEKEEAPEGVSRVRSVLGQLSPMRRRIIEQRLEGFSNQEIAVNLSISKKTVENQLNRAFSEIKKLAGVPLFLLLLILRDLR
jgi:RNA polymerase sigma factor (sigma-70 family)